MRIAFDPDFDTGAWPGPLGSASISRGEAWVGPTGLLGLLETALGLGGPPAVSSERAASLVKRCRAMAGFWSASAQVDPLATARRLLESRDLLALHGWRGQATGGRLAALAEVTNEVAPGVPDRLRAVVDALGRRSAGVESVRLFVARESVPGLWREVLDGLEKQGTAIEPVTLPPAPAHGDLLAARSGGFVPAGDGSLQLLRANGPLEAADQLAASLAARPSLDSVVLIGADSVLDAALRRHGLPTVGARGAVSDDALLQLLPLVIALGWAPPDPQRALELLTMPVSPVPPSLAWRLVRALHEHPAVDSDGWRVALEDGLAKVEDAEDREKLRARLAVLLTPTVRGPSYPIAEARARLDVLGRWFQGRLSTDEANASRFGRAYSQCRRLERLLTQSGLETFGAPELKRFIEEASRDLGQDADFDAQAGLSHVGSPAAICGPARTIVWWSFDRASAPRPAALPFSAEEIRFLEQSGVRLPSPGEEALLKSQRWSRPLDQATDALLLVSPRRGLDGEESFPHPLFDEIAARATEGVGRLVRSAPLGHDSHTRPRPAEALPISVRQWNAPAGAVQRREVESPSSVGALLGCSLQWVLNYAGKVRGGASARLPEAENLLGSTAHEVLAKVLARTEPMTPAQAREAAVDCFDKEGPRLAAALFQPGSEAERARARQITGDSAAALFELLAGSGMKVLAVEQAVSADAFGTRFEGRPDLVVGHDEAHPAIVDLKWGGARYRRESLASGASYQLAAYSFLLGGKDGAFPPTGYFILQNQRLLTADPAVFPGAQVVSGPGNAQTWDALARGHEQAWDAVRRGAVVAAANVEPGGDAPVEADGVDRGRLKLVAPCRFCDYAGICGQAFAPDVAAGTGGAA